MKVVIQRCLKGKVSVNNKTINEINKGFVILLGINKEIGRASCRERV